jgi:hypothetical protein
VDEVKRTPIRKVSKKRAKEDRERAKLLEARFGPRRWWRCEVRDRPVMMAELGACRGLVHGHEVVKSSQMKDARLDMDNIKLLCDFHNGWVEDNPVRAHELGLMKHNWEGGDDN